MSKFLGGTVCFMLVSFLPLCQSGTALTDEKSQSTAPALSPEKSILDKVDVVIANYLSNKIKISVDCKSKNDDLGYHVVPWGNVYEFEFRVNFWGTTLFFCRVTQLGGASKSLQFDSFNAKRDVGRCKHLCRWVVNDDGVHGYNDINDDFDITINWP